MNINDHKLCFIDQSDEYSEQLEVYFTELDLDKQWGDDWNDAPYEHNAGIPYDEDYSRPEQGVEDGRGIYQKVSIYKVYIEPKDWKTHFITPRTGTLNSNYSVENINSGVVPWLVIKDESGNLKAKFMAGTTYAEFVRGCENLAIIYEPKSMGV